MGNMLDVMKPEVCLESEDGVVDIFCPATNNGWFGLQFYIISKEEVITVKTGQTVEKNDRKIEWIGELDKDIHLKLIISLSGTGRARIITPIIANRSSQEFAFSGYGFRIAGKKKGAQIEDHHKKGIPVYANSENLRYEKLPYCQAEYPFIRPMPVSVKQIGGGPSGPIPALFLGRLYGNLWLMEGALSQNRHILSWRLGLTENPQQMINYRSYFIWTGGREEFIKSGSEMVLESTVYGIINSPPDRLYYPYMEELKCVADFAGKKSRLDRESVYCTWNFGVFTNITEEDCLKRMDIVADIQGKGFFQIDHGYQPKLSGEPAVLDSNNFSIVTPEVDVYYPDAKNAWDISRFPSGPKGFVKACKKRGLRPAIWWSPRVAKNGPLQKAHPDWLLRNGENEPVDLGHLLLDPSVAEVRAFIENCIRIITEEWGFEGIKLDFFSWMFDYEHAVFRNGETGVVWKKWLLKMIRSYLGPDGYLLYCISCPLGNPFFAVDGPDAFRAGVDIHTGEWGYHLNSSAWLLPAVLATGKDTWYPNIDSCMGSPDIPMNERRSRLAFTYITGGMLEFSGPLEKMDANALDDYRRIVARCDQGGIVRCPDIEAFYGRPLPRVLIRHNDPESRTRKELGVAATVGFFNWADTGETIALPFSKLGLEMDRGQVKMRDFWTQSPYVSQNELLMANLPARGHRLLDIIPNCGE